MAYVGNTPFGPSCPSPTRVFAQVNTVFGPFEGQSDSLTIQLARKLPLEPLDAASSTANTGAPSAKPKGHRHGLRDDWQAVQHQRKNPRIGDRLPIPAR